MGNHLTTVLLSPGTLTQVSWVLTRVSRTAPPPPPHTNTYMLQPPQGGKCCYNHHFTKSKTKAQRGNGHCFKFPIATATNHQKLGVLKPYKVINFQSGSHKSKIRIPGLQSRCWQGSVPFGGALKDTPFLCLFHLLEAACILCFMAPLIHLQNQQCQGKSSSCYHLSGSPPFISPVYLRQPLWSHWAHPDNSG